MLRTTHQMRLTWRHEQTPLNDAPSCVLPDDIAAELADLAGRSVTDVQQRRACTTAPAGTPRTGRRAGSPAAAERPPAGPSPLPRAWSLTAACRHGKLNGTATALVSGICGRNPKMITRWPSHATATRRTRSVISVRPDSGQISSLGIAGVLITAARQSPPDLSEPCAHRRHSSAWPATPESHARPVTTIGRAQ
jgi:hypothetical protein